ncbi:MAG: tryptophan--tRNA ligase, partial [Thermoplasmata archaeon]|nr:tryptophan--tRNA ligase [Thermoplasmata archaeon]
MPEERIDPWASVTYDYKRLIERFGIEPFGLDRFPLPDPPEKFRRGVVFGHRGFPTVHRAITAGEPFAVLTGLAPSGRMHFGHKMVLDQVLAYHRWGADVSVAVADLEAWGARGVPVERSRRIAMDEYLLNYVALGLPVERTQIYWQSGRKDVEDLAFVLSRAVNWSTMRAVYGFNDETNMAHIQAPMVQVGDILHVQLERWGGPRPTIVPVGVDQDPHIRVSRDIARSFRAYGVQEVRAADAGVPRGART